MLTFKHLGTMALAAACSLFAAAQSAPAMKSGVDKADFDTSVAPGQDFFQYVNGNWIKQNPIPAEYGRWGSFPKLRDDNLVLLRELLEGLDDSATANDADKRKLRDFYRTAMDEAKRESLGAKPLADELKNIADIQDKDALIQAIGHLHIVGVSPLFRFYVSQDDKQSDRYAMHLRQGGLGLPERGYYFPDNDAGKKILEQYREHIAKMLTLAGDSAEQANAAAEAVLAIETKLAEASRTPVALRDAEKNYNKKSPQELQTLTPKLKWENYFHVIDAPAGDYFIVGQPEFFERVDELLGAVPLDQWKAYLRWHSVHSAASYLSDAFETENFNFYGKTLRGVEKMQPRWKRAIATIDSQMGEALGKLYVEKHFTPDAKKRMDALVKNVLAVYRERIESRPWMSDETKQKALAKLEKFTPKIGYPDKWRDYSSLEINDESYLANVRRTEVFDFKYQLDKLDKPIDRNEWHMTPPTVNAYYNASMNEIVFPAGILQPPFFNFQADDAVNYGAIGAVIGHEITHGFDDQGSRFDGDGNLKNWWTEQDRAQFTALADKLVKQYDDCVAVDDAHVNGKLTLGENLADLGGVAIAFEAWQKSLNGHPAPVIDDLTGPQRFFMGYAQVWRGSVRDAEQRVLLRTDPHSPGKFRTLVPLSNFKPFYEAFGVKQGDAMYRPEEERVEVW